MTKSLIDSSIVLLEYSDLSLAEKIDILDGLTTNYILSQLKSLKLAYSFSGCLSKGIDLEITGNLK